MSWPTRRSKGLALGKRAGWFGLCVPGKGGGHLRPVPVSSLSASFALLWLPGPRLRIHSEALTDVSHVGMAASDPPCQRRKADEAKQSQGCEEGFGLTLDLQSCSHLPMASLLPLGPECGTPVVVFKLHLACVRFNDDLHWFSSPAVPVFTEFMLALAYLDLWLLHPLLSSTCWT